MAKIALINGPNLNLLGQREPEIYGEENLATLEARISTKAKELGHDFSSHQSQHEGELIEIIHNARRDNVDVIILNPAGYTHTSVALRDALLAVAIPFVEVHLSNIHARETFRKTSYFSDIALACISGLGVYSYELAILAAHYHTTQKEN